LEEPLVTSALEIGCREEILLHLVHCALKDEPGRLRSRPFEEQKLRVVERRKLILWGLGGAALTLALGLLLQRLSRINSIEVTTGGSSSDGQVATDPSTVVNGDTHWTGKSLSSGYSRESIADVVEPSYTSDRAVRAVKAEV
jgi:hypothetical protein